MREYDIWTEGFEISGQGSGARHYGRFMGETFKDAVIAFRDSLNDEYSIKCIDIDKLTFWGCRFFDNENDARRSFG